MIYFAKGSYCTTTGKLVRFGFYVIADGLDDATAKVKDRISGYRRQRYARALDLTLREA